MTRVCRKTILTGVEPILDEGQNMASVRSRLATLLMLASLSACTSATDRLNQGIELQSQGRYFEAVYRYADAVESDRELVEAQDRLLAAGDTAVMFAMDDADELERRGDPVQAAGLYRQIDQMTARVREVGLRLDLPPDYATIRRAIFDNAINWQMVQGDEASNDGRWEVARSHYLGARGDFLPSRDQVEESYAAEIRVLLEWSAVELQDRRPRMAYDLAQEALEVRPSPARETVLAARDLQEQALDLGTIVLAVVPVMADPGVREWLGGEFEVQLDSDLSLDHWNRPPLFVEIADPLVLRTELRGLLRGQATQSPLLVGRALDLIGADLAVMIRLTGIEVVEEDVDREEHEAVVTRAVRQGARRSEMSDTVTYTTLRGALSYYLEADILLVDPAGREANRFTASSRQSGPFERGEFDGDPSLLGLDGARGRFFDPAVISGQMASIEAALLEDLAVAIAAGTFDQVLAAIQ
jgi:tetratricopeptide (TPR) repeat protein